MDIKATFTRALQGDMGQYEITFTTRDKIGVLKLKTQSPEKVLDLQVKEHREKRSLDANAYFHVLLSKIAEKTNVGLEDVKKRIVEDYGTVAFVARIPADADLETIYKYSKLIGASKGTKTPCNDWYIFKPTHELNTKEMARLIDGVIQEAKQLDIETKTPKELAEMMSLWAQQK